MGHEKNKKGKKFYKQQSSELESRTRTKHNEKYPSKQKSKKEEKRDVEKVARGKSTNSQALKLCSVFDKCGGCTLLDMSYEKQLKYKNDYLNELLKEFGPVEPVIGMKNPKNYRNKVVSSFGEDKRHNIITGIYEQNSHYIVPMDYCMLENKKADDIIITIRELMKSFKYRAFKEDNGFGLVRHVLVRMAQNTGEIMVVLVLSTPILPSKNNFIKALRKVHPEITTIVLNVNYKPTSMILGEKEIVLYGKGFIVDELCGKKFRISAKSFYQVNTVQTALLYKKAIEMANFQGNEVVLDAYCGTGTIGIILADRVKQVIGVELNGDAVKDARTNAKNNNVKNIEFYQKDAGEFLVQMADQEAKVDIVVMDPPRSGSSEIFLESVSRLKPKKVVYISCGPESLARDLRSLKKKGYRVQKMAAVDMFPWTKHVETVCLLSKLNVDHHIEVELNMDELDLTSAESKATYAEIKDYVLENSGLKVTNLYIAQVKDKMGIKERVNYHVSKKEDAKVPQCPADKEKAIIEALEHFNMID